MPFEPKKNAPSQQRFAAATKFILKDVRETIVLMMTSFQGGQPVNRLYKGVIEEVCTSVREAFLDEGVDEQVLQELKQVWETKVLATKAIDSFHENVSPVVRGSVITGVPAGTGIRIPVVPFSPQTISATNLALQHGVLAGNPQSFLIQPLSAGNVRLLSNSNQISAQLIPSHVLSGCQAGPSQRIYQVDGSGGLSDDEEVDEILEEEETSENLGPVEEGEPLNSDDDVSNEDANELFEADSVVACQYEKVTRTRNKWKFIFKDGIMNLNGKDFVFNRATGEAEF
ncbi:unnamed protein product [Soboliphyme baturini]|uniref:Transcription initiation factor IIA subunit 1 n=1 Tax=Soboliphyme baturini TaxID=241478 RepID=A0A183IWI0_9BILA|nr:unnamed protein product [Soboliphyme baturini]